MLVRIEKPWGEHIVQCSDIMSNQDELINAIKDKVQIFYCDPPWGNGMIKFFDTLRKKQTNEFSTHLPQNQIFLERLATLAIQSNAQFICVENGEKWSKETEEIFINKGLQHITTITGFYDKPLKPMKLHLFMAKSYFQKTSGNKLFLLEKYFNEIVQNKSGFDLVEKAIHCCLGTPHFQKELRTAGVFDPCCGFGMTAKVAVKNKMQFFGNEFNSKRLEKTLKVLNNAH